MTGPNASARSLFKNAGSQIAGRLFLSLGRLGAALLIVHQLGADSFGEYALVLNFVALFEWLVDFGQTDIAVRDICQEPEREAAILGALGWLKLAQGLVLAGLLPLLLVVMAYPPSIVQAGMAGGASVLCYAGVQVFRTVFKVGMCMERDVLAELGGLAAMLPLTYWASRAGAGTAMMVGCYSVARGVFLLLMVLFARRMMPQGVGRPSLADIRALLARSAPLGFTGLLVAVYDTLATVILSKLADIHVVAEYAAATRFVFPVIIIVQALSSAFYPPLAAFWRSAPARFAGLQQAALQISLLVGGGLFCGVFGGASFLMGLMGPSIAGAAPILQIMTVVVLARSITTVMSPLFVVAGWQRLVLWVTLAFVLLQFGAQLILVPRFGIMGAVIGYLTVELLFCTVPVALLSQYAAKVWLKWAIPLRLVACAAVAVGLAELLPSRGSIWGGLLSGVLFLGLTVVSGSVSLGQAREVLQDVAASRQAAAVPPAAA